MYRISIFLTVILLFGGGCKAPKSSGAKPSANATVPVTNPSIQPPITPTVTMPLTKAEAIAAGLDFLSKSRWEWDIVYLYSYLQPKFGWANLPMQVDNKAMADSLRRVGDPPALRILDQMVLFQRLVDPKFQLPRERMQSAEEEDQFTLVALYCDIMKPDSATFFPILRREMAAGDYRLTHALLTCNWLAERDCFSNSELAILKQKLIQANFELVHGIREWIDLRIEAAALLAAAGEPTPQIWVDELLREQQPDGGWRKDRHQSGSALHPTLLALWFLSETN